MTDDGDDRASEVKSAVGYLCTNLSDIQALLESAGNAGPLNEALRVLRSEPMDGGALRRTLDALDAEMVRGGDVLGIYRRPRRGMSARGLGPRRRVDVEFRCPRRHCARLWTLDEGAAPPACEIFDEPLSWDRR